MVRHGMENGRSVISIGNFDGVHVGHAALIRRARRIADEASRARGGAALRVVAMAFDPHPAVLLRPSSAPPAIMAFSRRAELLRELGADEVIRLEPTPALLDQSSAEFIAGIVRTHRPLAFVEGHDFHFGKGRGGNIGVLRELGTQHGFEVDIVEPVEVALTDHQLARASSSLVRWLLSMARARDAAIVLGRPHELNGGVVQGDRRGRTIGFPTANLATADLLPADGVYACAAILPDGSRYAAALNIGARPTFNGVERRVEAHLIGAPGRPDAPALEGLPEYAWPLRLEVHAWLRDQVKFDGVGSLVGQLRRDCARAVEIVAHPPLTPAGGGDATMDSGVLFPRGMSMETAV